MPTSRYKNLVYRLALPVFSPAVPADPLTSFAGRRINKRRSLIRIIRRNHVSGGAISVKSGSEQAVIFTRSIHTDNDPDIRTFFRVASITKMATALVAVLLMDRGILDPDKPVAEMLPDGPAIPELKGISSADLLSHMSGLSDPAGLEQMMTEQRDLRTVISGCRCREADVFRYSNLGFGILGCVFESILGISVEQIFRDYLFEPLGLEATLSGVAIRDQKVMPLKRVLPWRSDDQGITVTPLGMIPLESAQPSRHYGYTAGSMYITLPSMVRLTECIRDGGAPLLSGGCSAYMKQETAHYGASSPTLFYGHGLLIVKDRSISDGNVCGHQGFAYGCVDGAFWEEDTGNIMVSLNGCCSEARTGRFGIVNRDLCRYAFREEIPSWK